MHFDLTPLYRSSIGYDSLASMLETVASRDAGTSSYPPYNIELLSENAYRITMAVAGFAEEDISIEVKEQSLTITGNKAENPETEYLHQGIAARNFERRFNLAEHDEITG
ncbi:MAG: Hsp20 family protein, partial [Rhodobacteraceae bacterium]|nr:Hsp20 family protein [Paracoccaceae bacterium]